MKKRIFAALILIIFLSACNATKITSMWKSQEPAPKNYKKYWYLALYEMQIEV